MSFCDLPVISGVCDTAGEAAASVAAAPFQFLSDTAGNVASWMLETLWLVFDLTTAVDVSSDEFISVFNLVAGIGMVLIVLFAVIQAASAGLKRDAGGIGRAIVGAGKATLGTFVIVALTATLLAITDALCVGVVHATGTTIQQMGGKILALVSLAGLGTMVAPGPMLLLHLFMASLVISATAIIWFTLMIRKALILITLLLGPLVVAGLAWDAARDWIKKWAVFLVALIVSKLVMTLIFLLAWKQIGTPLASGFSAITEPLAGIVLLLIAAFAPYMVYKLLSVFGVDMYHAMSAESEAKQALNRPVPLASAPQNVAKVLDDKGSGDGGNSTGSPSQNSHGTSGPPAPAVGAGGAPSGTLSASAGPAGQVGAGSAAGGGSGGAAAGAGAAAGPVAGALVAGQVIQGAITAGPKLGQMVGDDADTQADGASAPAEQSSPSPAPPPELGPSPQPKLLMPPPRPSGPDAPEPGPGSGEGKE